MKTFIFTNEQATFRVEYKTDHIGSMDNFTVHDIKVSSTSGLTQDDLIRSGINFERLPYTYQAFKTFAEDNNLTLLEVSWADNSSSSLNASTALSITTASIKDGTNGVPDIQTLTMDTFANSTQGDYISITNWNGDTLAAWLDLDADGTAPTGAIYLAADYQVIVPIVTGDVAVDVAAAIVAAINSDGNQYVGWTKYATIADAGSGDVTITQTQVATVTAAVPKDDDDVGVGSITVAATQTGVTGVAEEETITLPTTAGATQGDFIILSNYRDESIALWLDIDAAGTEPSGVKYLATDYQAMVSIVTAGSAAANGTLFYDVLVAVGQVGWNAFVDVVDNEDGTVTITQKEAANITAAEPLAIAEGGAGSITAATDTAGQNGNIYAEAIAVTGGNTPYTYAAGATMDLPAGLTFNTLTGTLEGVATATKSTAVLDVDVTDVYGIETDTQLTFDIR